MLYSHIVSIALLGATLLASSAHAAPSKRLIETAPGVRAWMSAEQIQGLQRKSHLAGHCGGFFDVTEHPEEETRAILPFSTMASSIENRAPKQAKVVEPLLKQLTAANLEANVDRLSQFHNRFYEAESGADAAKWIQGRFQELAKNRKDVQVSLFQHTFKQPSVIARIPGTGPKANEIVIIGAHEDSVNWGLLQLPWGRSNKRAPGADDDASGVATVLEVFRVLAESNYKPERTLEFMTYAGEELGLLGSLDIARQYQKDKKNVVGVMQLDMTMYKGKTAEMQLIVDHTDKAQTEFAAKLINAYVKVPFKEDRCGYGCSDHASWTRMGYPAVFPFEAAYNEMNPNIHKAKDTLDKLNTEYGLHFAKLALAYAVEMSRD